MKKRVVAVTGVGMQTLFPILQEGKPYFRNCNRETGNDMKLAYYLFTICLMSIKCPWDVLNLCLKCAL